MTLTGIATQGNLHVRMIAVIEAPFTHIGRNIMVFGV
jgi:hypothetical protein